MPRVIDPYLLWLVGSVVQAIGMIRVGQDVGGAVDDKDWNVYLWHKVFGIRHTGYQPFRWQTVALGKIGLTPIGEEAVQNQSIEAVIQNGGVHQSRRAHAHAQTRNPVAGTFCLQPVQSRPDVQRLLRADGGGLFVTAAVSAEVKEHDVVTSLVQPGHESQHAPLGAQEAVVQDDRGRTGFGGRHVPRLQAESVCRRQGEIAEVNAGVGRITPVRPLWQSPTTGRVVAKVEAVEGPVDPGPGFRIGLAKDVAGHDRYGRGDHGQGSEKDKDSVLRSWLGHGWAGGVDCGYGRMLTGIRR